MSTGWTDGAVDLHVHCAPSFFPRWGDGLDVVRACEAAGLAAVLLKAHEGGTYDGAAALDRLSPTLRVRGGIVLNRYVGGLNPAAVEAAFRLGGRCVWFPTIDADAHARAFGSTGAYPAQRGGVESPSGIRVLDDAGRCVPEALEVLELAAEHDALVATGHLSAKEVAEVVRRAVAAGVHRLLVQHPCFPVPALPADELEPLVRAGAVLELTALSVSPACTPRRSRRPRLCCSASAASTSSFRATPARRKARRRPRRCGRSPSRFTKPACRRGSSGRRSSRRRPASSTASVVRV